MQVFKEMMRVASTVGFWGAAPGDEGYAAFWKYAPQCEVFVFTDHPDTALVGDAAGFTVEMPFKCFSVEILNSDGVVQAVAKLEGGGSVLTFMVVDRTFVYALIVTKNALGVDCSRLDSLSEGEPLLIARYCKALSMQGYATKSVTAAFKSPKKSRGSVRRDFVIRRVNHVHPKIIAPVAAESMAESTREFSHRFNVRGHWANFYTDETKTQIDMSRIGKDPAGDYCVPGKTWVKECIKGPEGKELIRKTRIVHNAKLPTDPNAPA